MSEQRHSLCYAAIRALRRAAEKHGASEAELAGIERFDRFEAQQVDIDRLAPLGRLAGLPWDELFRGQ